MNLIVNYGETCCRPTNSRDAVQTLLAIKRCKEKDGNGTVYHWEGRDDCDLQTEEPHKT